MINNKKGTKSCLLHICCACCATTCIEELKDDGFKVVGFFYNPNIHPEEEYLKRKKELSVLKEKYSIEIIEGDYDKELWFEECSPFSYEKEGGHRCSLCYLLRLKKTYMKSKELGIEYFTTTLTVSPHKKSAVINQLGKEIGDKMFLERDFKKKDGFKKSVCRSKEWGLYRQRYCGCIYSLQK